MASQMDERLASMSPDELRSTMRSLGYRTQNDLASAIGVSRSAVSMGQASLVSARDAKRVARTDPGLTR